MIVLTLKECRSMLVISHVPPFAENTPLDFNIVLADMPIKIKVEKKKNYNKKKTKTNLTFDISKKKLIGR